MSDVEERALRMGWVSEDNFKGDPDRWVDAETFVARGQEILPIMKERFGKLEENYTALETQNKAVTQKLSEVTDNLSKFAKFHKETAQRSYKRALSDLKTRQRDAVEDGNTDEFDKIEKEITDLGEQVTGARTEEPGPKRTDNGVSPDYPSWHQKNPWYTTDPELTAYAHGVFPMVVEEHKAQGKILTDAEVFELVTERVRQTFPQKFANPNRDAPPAVEGGGGDGDSTAGTKKKGWGDLPAEAKEAYLTHFSGIKDFTQANYATDYWQEEGV